ncbi:MAG: hypothetical protein ACREFL_05620 [Stellaceae bacterium]
MKLPVVALFAAMSIAGSAFAQSSNTTPVNPNANPTNCSPAFPNCTGTNKTPGNAPGTARNAARQEGKIPQTATEPNLPMKEQRCPADEPNCAANMAAPSDSAPGQHR